MFNNMKNHLGIHPVNENLLYGYRILLFVLVMHVIDFCKSIREKDFKLHNVLCSLKGFYNLFLH